jgi:hypothetical protein
MSEPLAPHAWLDSLRREGAARVDPARWRYLESLAQRAAGQPEPVRHLLNGKLQQALAAFAQRVAQAPRPLRPQAAPPAVCAPLLQLNAYICGVSPAAAKGEAPEQGELASVRGFRQAWSRRRAQDQVAQAAARKPANAGPLNSHALVLQALDLMQELSPDYLRRFVVQVETLQWLEQAREKYPRGPDRAKKAGKPPRRKRENRP